MTDKDSDQLRELTGEVMSLRGNINAMSSRMEALIEKGFANGDLDLHRQYHEKVIEWQELRNQMVRAALIKAAQSGGIVALGWIVYALWTSFKFAVSKGA